MKVYAVLIVAFMPAVIFSAPLNVVGDNAGNGIDSAEDEVILSVSTIVNGVKKSEAAAIVEELERLAGDIKSAAFEAFMMEVTQKAMTVAEVKQAVEAVKELMEESLAALSEVRTKVSRIAASPSPGLTEEESIFLSNVRYSLPDVLQFTRTQFRGAVADVRRTKW